MNNIAHLGADQSGGAEIVVAGDELVPELAHTGATYGALQVERADLVDGRGRRVCVSN